ncbi:MAG: DUF2867 domain-containing protein [Epsilonproteobacteria bacterium]|nr:DUF2867 domain-containing protein [Campylobacterota bacterium]
MRSRSIAIFGATGYIGLILSNRFIETTTPLKLFVRNKQRVKYLKRYSHISSCDLALIEENRARLIEELKTVGTLYYLIHSMDGASSSEYLQRDLTIASLVGECAKEAGVEHIIYLGGLGISLKAHPLSMHLSDRQLVAEALRKSGVPTTEIRAGVIMGAGSASFEIIRALGDKLPFIPKLSYASGRCNPIDVDDVIAYLLNAADDERYKGEIIEIGAKESCRYDEMVCIYAKAVRDRNLKVVWLPFASNILTKKIVARIVSYLSAIPYALAYPLIDGLDSMAIKGSYAVENIDSSIKPLGVVESIQKASEYEAAGRVESYWSLPLNLQVLSQEKESFLHIELDGAKEQLSRLGMLYEIRERIVHQSEVEAIFKEIKRVGGDYGYWSPQWMWRVRAFIDKLVGGPGLEVGRRDGSREIRIGQRLDFWIVSAFKESAHQKILTLKGRIKSPGSSWLQFALIEQQNGLWLLSVRAYFAPSNIFGYLYWYSLFFIHKFIFTEMINNIVKCAHVSLKAD